MDHIPAAAPLPEFHCDEAEAIPQRRAEHRRQHNDPGFKALIEEFMQTSRLFRENWPLQDVQVVTDCHKRWFDPRIGEMEFEHVTLQPPAHPDLKIMIYTAGADTASSLQSLISTHEHG